MSKAKMMLTIAAGMALAADHIPYSHGYRVEIEKSKPMPLTDDELEKLQSLSGKEKKRYVKQLREKYLKQPGGAE